MAWLITNFVLIAYATMTLSPVIGFGAYIGVHSGNSQTLDIPKMFTSLVIINLLSSPIIHLTQALPSFGAAAGCFERIQSFLDRERQSEGRLSDLSLGNESHDEKDGERGPSPNLQDPVITVQNVKFSQRNHSNDNPGTIRIFRGQFAVVTGPIGCGKSSFLNAVLGERPYTQGLLTRSTTSIGYCSQMPWLREKSLLDNMMVSSSFDRAWLETVFYSCGLERLVDALKDETLVTNLSISDLGGAEKQRLVSDFFPQNHEFN
jgi:ATP-binding cassette, subfamily C (CFTR/MRP), member 1